MSRLCRYSVARLSSFPDPISQPSVPQELSFTESRELSSSEDLFSSQSLTAWVDCDENRPAPTLDESRDADPYSRVIQTRIACYGPMLGGLSIKKSLGPFVM